MNFLNFIWLLSALLTASLAAPGRHQRDVSPSSIPAVTQFRIFSFPTTQWREGMGYLSLTGVSMTVVDTVAKSSLFTFSALSGLQTVSNGLGGSNVGLLANKTGAFRSVNSPSTAWSLISSRLVYAGATGFCVDNSDVVNAVFGSTPFGCLPIQLYYLPVSSSSKTSTTPQATTSMKTTTPFVAATPIATTTTKGSTPIPVATTTAKSTTALAATTTKSTTTTFVAATPILATTTTTRAATTALTTTTTTKAATTTLTTTTPKVTTTMANPTTTPANPTTVKTTTTNAVTTSVGNAGGNTTPGTTKTTTAISTTTAAQATQTSDVTGMTYVNAMLLAHNVHRSNHSVPALGWNLTLASIAAITASSCVYKHDTTTGGGGYGQNIGAGAIGNQAAALVGNLMYNGEINKYPLPYGVNSPDMTNFEAWGHYSQMVWDTTATVGCVTQYCPAGLANTGSNVPPYFTVCNYYPPGNYIGEFSSVPAPNGNPTVVIVGT